MRRIVDLVWRNLQALLVIVPVFVLALLVVSWLASQEPVSGQSQPSSHTVRTATGERAEPAGIPASPPRTAFQSPLPGVKPPAPGVGVSPVAPAVTGAPTPTPVPEQVVLGLANNPIFVGFVLLAVIAVLGGALWFWTRQHRT